MKYTLLKWFILILLIYISSDASYSQSCGCDHVIPMNQDYIDGAVLGAGPGDVVCIQAGTRKSLGLKNFTGAVGNPIIFKNCGGQVVIQNTDWYYGIKMENCKYFIFTGSGDAAFQYGIKVAQTTAGISGLNIGLMSTDFEVERVEISGTGFAGIMAKSDPDCSGVPNRGNFVMKNVSIHDNYVHDVGGEGIYVGFPHYTGIRRACGADSIVVLPHEVSGVRIYKNRTTNTAREGIQVGCAVSDVEIYENTITDFGRGNVKWQRSGVHFSTGTTGKFYRNIITRGPGPGIWLNGRGDNYILNNVISGVGDAGEGGIMVHDSLVSSGTGYHIVNNTLVNVGSYGMIVYTDKPTPVSFLNNIVVANDGGYSVPGSVGLTTFGNVHTGGVEDMRFEDWGVGNFHLTAVSPAVDAGEDASPFGVTNDFEFIVRPRGKAYDAGAFESPHERMYLGFFIYPNPIYTVAHIEFVLADDTEGRLKVLDIHGKEVAVISEGPFKGSTQYKYDFDSFFLAQGMYFYILETTDEVFIEKIILVDQKNIESP